MGSAGGVYRAVAAVIVGAALAACAACTPEPLPLVTPSPTPSSTPPVPPPPAREVVVGVDKLTRGFNPHTLADLTPLTSAVAGLVLPSAFRQEADGGWTMDDTLLTSAEVTDTAPFTVTYRIRHDAQWSDTAPIAAEDFGYLVEQMRTRPGVVDSAGYQLVDKVVSRDGGKTAEVVFLRPYPAWRTLFRQLLPAHLLKDAPGGWSEALDGGLGVSGGPFVMTSVDFARGELVLARNDRYWDEPAALDRILLRQGSDAARIEALRSGGAQAALFGQPNAITEALLADAAGSAASAVVPQPVLASVLLRPESRALRDDRVRGAVAAALDRSALIATGSGSGPSGDLRADGLVVAPSEPGYHPTAPDAAPARPDPAAVHRLLTERGYRLVPAGSAGAPGSSGSSDGAQRWWQRGGTPLRVVVAAPEGRQPYEVLASRVVAQLRDAGIRAELRSVPPDELFGTLLDGAAPGAGPDDPAGAGQVDIAVVPQPVAADPPTQLASWFGCPLVVPAKLAPAPDNPAGFCDLALQPSIESLLTGRSGAAAAPSDGTGGANAPITGPSAGQPSPPQGTAGPAGAAPPRSVPDEMEAALWQQAVSVPLYQQASLLVTTDELAGVRPGSPLAGPFDGAERWQLRR